MPRGRQEEFFIRRLRSALEHVRSQGSAETLNDELKYLSDMAASRLHAGFGLFRVILWAIPILGFLGTVIGITMALNSVDFKSPDQSMMQVLKGLGLKFDTTALALAMSMVLMFVHFFVDRSGNELLEHVDRRAEEELSGRFQLVSSGADGQMVAFRRMAETMIQVSDRLVQRQAELWQASMENAAVRWANMAKVGGEQLQASLAGALSDGLKMHAQHLAAAEQASIQANRQHWDKIIQGQAHSTQNLAALQAGVTRQVEVIEQTVAAVGEVARLEDALNRNLSTLAGAKHFEQTVMSLAAAINLLNARLAEMPAPPGDKTRWKPTGSSGGMKFNLHNQHRRQREGAPSISLFPFLAVLICTMGALVPLLFAITRQARLQAAQTAVAKIAERKAEIKTEHETMQWRIEQLRTSRTKTNVASGRRPPGTGAPGRSLPGIAREVLRPGKDRSRLGQT